MERAGWRALGATVRGDVSGAHEPGSSSTTRTQRLGATTTIRGRRADEEWRRRLADAREGWGTVEYFRQLVAEWAPERVGDEAFLEWFVRHMRHSLSPGAALGFLRATMGADVRDVLSAVRVPTLVLAAPEPARTGGVRLLPDP